MAMCNDFRRPWQWREGMQSAGVPVTTLYVAAMQMSMQSWSKNPTPSVQTTDMRAMCPNSVFISIHTVGGLIDCNRRTCKVCQRDRCRRRGPSAGCMSLVSFSMPIV